MDIFKQKRNLILTIVVLVVINIITLLLLWLGKPKPNDMRGLGNGENEKVRIQEMLKEELGFSTDQAEKFIILRKNHKEQTSKLDNEIMLIKKEMFDKAMYGNNTNISDSLLNLSLEKQSQLEKLVFEHFVKLKQICTPEQQKILFKHMHNILGTPNHGGLPPGEIPNGPPPGEMREGHPPPPPRN